MRADEQNRFDVRFSSANFKEFSQGQPSQGKPGRRLELFKSSREI